MRYCFGEEEKIKNVPSNGAMRGYYVCFRNMHSR